MYKHTNSHKTVYRFKRFCRGGWAAYRSMHREVTIGRLAARVADCSLKKTAAAAALLIMLPLASTAQTDRETETRSLAEVQIVLSADTLTGSAEPAAVITAEQIQQSNIHSLADLIALLPGVDVRTRGVGDAQADLSLRGGTFDQAVLMVNGVNLTDMQTGHHTLDLPIDIAMVERVELLAPAALMARGIVGFCGAVNLVVCDEYADRLSALLSGGSYGTADASLLATKGIGDWRLTAAAAYHRSDGYRPNTDYRHGSLWMQAARHSSHDDLLLQMGGQSKAFGSNSFYSTRYPDQYEATRTLTASATHLHRYRWLRTEAVAYGRLHRDRFELFRDGYTEAPSWYGGHNHHLGSLAGLRGRAIVPLAVGELMSGAELRYEGIRSNVLGHADSTLPSPYTKSDRRRSVTAFAGYHYADRHWNLQAVVLGLQHSRFSPDYGLAADASLRLSPVTLHLSVARTYRLPTFTDLYYQSATQQANPNLGPEHSTMAETGASWRTDRLAISLNAYYRQGNDIIDWVRHTDTEMWYSMNHTAANALGGDLTALWHMGPCTLRMAYAYCHMQTDSDGWISAYALEYLRHQLSAEVTWRPTPRLLLGVQASYRQREGEWVDADNAVHPYGDVLLVGATAEYRLGRATLFVDANNLLGTQWRDHGGIPMPGRSVTGGIRFCTDSGQAR